jgi:hypothetical protein
MVISLEARQHLFALVSSWTEQHIKADSLDEAEQLAEEVGRVVSECAVQRLVSGMSRQASYEGATRACQCGGRARFVGYRARFVKTTRGEVRIERAYYHCQRCKRSQTPWDERQGLNERVFSPRLKALVCQVVGRLPYKEAVELLEELGVVKLDVSSAEVIALEVGVRLRQQEERLRAVLEKRQKQALWEALMCEGKPDAPASEFGVRGVSGQRLYIQADAAKAHIDGDWHDVKVGGVFAASANKDGVDTPTQRSYVAAQTTAEEFGIKLRVRAEEWNVGAYPQAIFMADGADWLWKQAETHFPQARHILDFYHAAEHIWSLARVLYSQEDPARSARGDDWAKNRLESLRKQGPIPLLRALKNRKARTEQQKESIRRELGYFARNAHRMDYPAYRAEGLMIGSGPIEAACKVVVGQRLKQAGMRWSSAGADSVLAIRSALLSRSAPLIEQMARAA